MGALRYPIWPCCHQQHSSPLVWWRPEALPPAQECINRILILTHRDAARERRTMIVNSGLPLDHKCGWLEIKKPNSKTVFQILVKNIFALSWVWVLSLRKKFRNLLPSRDKFSDRRPDHADWLSRCVNISSLSEPFSEEAPPNPSRCQPYVGSVPVFQIRRGHDGLLVDLPSFRQETEFVLRRAE